MLIVTTEELTKTPDEKTVKEIKRATRKHYSSEEKIRIVLDGLRGKHKVAKLCRRERIRRASIISGPKTSRKPGRSG